jgi:hypothetical protein
MKRVIGLVMNTLQSSFDTLLQSLPASTSSSRNQSQLNEHVKKATDNNKSKFSQEVRKSQWEYILRNEIFKLAVSATFYSLLIAIKNAFHSGDRRKGPERGG